MMFPMRATFPVHHLPLELNIMTIYGRQAFYETLRYAVFSTSQSLPDLTGPNTTISNSLSPPTQSVIFPKSDTLQLTHVKIG